MPLTLRCTKCGQQLAIADDLKGKQVQCPSCNEIYVVEKKQTSTGTVSGNRMSNTADKQTPASSHANPKPKATTKPGATPASDSGVMTCSSCNAKMRRPIAPGVTKFLCPGCNAVVHIALPEIHVPVGIAPKPSAIDDDPFADLNRLPTPVTTRPGSTRAGLGRTFEAVQTVRRPSNASSRRAGRPSRDMPSMLGPGWMIIVAYGLMTLATLSILALAVLNREDADSPGSFNAMLIVFGALLINYVLVFLGGLRMTLGAGKVITIVTCIAALSPTICLGALGFGVFVYPLAIAGSLWGLIALAVYHQPSPTLVDNEPSGPVSAVSNAMDYLRGAREELAQAPGDAVPASGFKAAGFILAGVALLCFCAFHSYLFYQHTNGQIEISRPGRAISGAIASGITGLGLLARGLSYFT